MKTYNKEMIEYYLSDKEWKTLGTIMFDNSTIKDRQKVFSMYIQLKETLIQFCKDGIAQAEDEYEYDKLGGSGVFRPEDAANDQGRKTAYEQVLATIKIFEPEL